MSISAVGPRRMTEPTTELSCEMRVVAEAARVSDLVNGLPRVQQGAAMQHTRGMIQTDRMYEVCVRRIPHTEELLKVSKRNPRFGRHLRRTEIRICEAISDDIADLLERLVGTRGDGRQMGCREQGSEEIVDRKLHVGVGRCASWTALIDGILNEMEKEAIRRCLSASAQATFRLESQMSDHRLARDVHTKPSPGPVLGNVRHRLRRIHERDITCIQLLDPIVLNHGCSAGKMKHCVVVFLAIKASIATCPLDAMDVATGNDRRASPDARAAD
jgi:hypothetical protein